MVNSYENFTYFYPFSCVVTSSCSFDYSKSKRFAYSPGPYFHLYLMTFGSNSLDYSNRHTVDSFIDSLNALLLCSFVVRTAVHLRIVDFQSRSWSPVESSTAQRIPWH